MATAVGLAALALYVATLAPGLSWAHDSADGGELAAAARVLGVAHPPGYPTYVLLAHVFALLPLGEVAVGTNLFSALCAAGAAALLAWTLAREGRHWAAATGAGLALAAAPMLWSQATITEVHALTALFTALLLACLARARPARGVVDAANAPDKRVRRARDTSTPRAPSAAQTEPSSRMTGTEVCGRTQARLRPEWRTLLALATGLVLGLGLGNHPVLVFAAPVAVLALLRLGRWGWLGLLGLGVGLGVYGALPILAAANPPINWGDPRTVTRWWWVVSGGPYRGFAFALALAHLPERALSYLGLLGRQFGVAGLILATLGLAETWAAERSLAAATMISVALGSAFAVGYNTSDSYLYLVPALVVVASWLGAGLDWAIGLAGGRRGAARAVMALAVVLPIVGAAERFPTQDLTRDRAPRAFRDAVLAAAPQESVILSERDAHTFALWYFRHAQGERSDVTVVDLGLLGYGWYNEQLAAELEAPGAADLLAQIGAESDAACVEAARLLGRPVCRIEQDGTGIACCQ